MIDKINSKFTYSTWVYIIAGLIVFFFTAELFGVSDFRIFYLASTDFPKGVDMYSEFYGNGFKYYYSPFFAMLMSPFTVLDVQVVGWIWKLANIILLYRIWALSMNYFDTSSLSKTQSRWLAIGAFLFGISLIYKNLHNHQLTIFLLWGILESIHLSEKGKWIKASLILALIINFKILPITLLPYLLYRGHWKTVASTVVFFGLYLILPALVIGMDQNIALHKSWWNLLNPQNTEHIIDVSEKQLSSLTTFIPVFLMDSAQWNENFDFQRNFLTLSPETTTSIILLVRLLFVGSVLYFLRSMPFQKENNALKKFWELGYILTVTVLIFPHQQDYGFLLIWPMLIYITYYMIISKPTTSATKWYISLAVLIILCLSINSFFLLGNFRKLWAYIKLLTWGTLFVLPFYYFITPGKIQKIIKANSNS